MRIDPRTNRVSRDDPGGREPPLGRRRRRRLGLGDRARPGRAVADRARAGPGHAGRSTSASAPRSSTFGGGTLVWTGNYIDGTRVARGSRAPTASRRRPRPAPPRRWRPERAGPGSAWRGARPRAPSRPPPAARSPPGAAKPDVLIASDLPLRGPGSADPRAIANAIRFVLERRGFRAGRAHGRLPVLRRVDGGDGRLRVPHLRRERERLRERRAAGGRDRHLLLVLRRGRDPDPNRAARVGRWRWSVPRTRAPA